MLSKHHSIPITVITIICRPFCVRTNVVCSLTTWWRHGGRVRWELSACAAYGGPPCPSPAGGSQKNNPSSWKKGARKKHSSTGVYWPIEINIYLIKCRLHIKEHDAVDPTSERGFYCVKCCVAAESTESGVLCLIKLHIADRNSCRARAHNLLPLGGVTLRTRRASVGHVVLTPPGGEDAHVCC